MMLKNIRALYQAMYNAKLSQHKKKELVKKRLKNILVSAYRHVPYYKKIMRDIGYSPEKDYNGPDDLKILPVTTKKDIKANDINLFLKEGVDKEKLYFDCTSGSTGIPLKIYFSYHEKTILTANWLRMLFLNGYSPFDRYFTLTAPANSDPNVNEGQVQRLGLFRKKAVFYPKSPRKTLNILLDYKPDVIYGTRSYLDLIAYELLKRKIRLQGLKFVVSGEEVITENHKRMYKEVFGADIIDAYGSAETTMIAYETKIKDGLNLCDDIAFFEFLDKNNNPVKDGEASRIIVTSLINHTMPFIRYDLGDLVTTGSSFDRDGNKIRKILKIMGRDNDNFVMPNGSRIFYHDFYDIIFKYNRIMQFQAIQKSPNHIQIIFAAEPHYFRKILTDVELDLGEILPKNCTFEILRRDFLEPDSSGKLRMLLSEVNNSLH